MARGALQTPASPSSAAASGDENGVAGRAADGRLEIKLIYGVEELGAVMHCSRCISAERTARRVALHYPGRVWVGKYSILSDEAANLGVCLSPTIVVGDVVVSCGKGIGEESLTRAVETCLADRQQAAAS